jgi:dihydroxyacetone kinase
MSTAAAPGLCTERCSMVLQMALEGVTVVGRDELKAMFAGGLASFATVSNAREGDKTMMDVLIAACRKAENSHAGIAWFFD